VFDWSVKEFVAVAISARWVDFSIGLLPKLAADVSAWMRWKILTLAVLTGR